MKHYISPVLNIYFFLHTKIFYQAYGISQILHFGNFRFGQRREIHEKKNFIGTASEKSILNCTAGKFYLYKDSNAFIQEFAIQFLGEQ